MSDELIILAHQQCRRASAGGAAGFTTHGLQGNIFTAADDAHYLYGAPATLGFADEFTIGWRFYRHEIANVNHMFGGVLTDTATQANSFSSACVLATTGVDDFTIRSYNSGGTNYNSVDGMSTYVDVGMTADAWTTIFMVYDGSADKADLHVNGGAAATRGDVLAHQTLTDEADRTLCLYSPRGTPTAPYGYCSHFGAWDRELTAAEIVALDAADNHDWAIASGDYGASAVSALVHFYAATDGTYLTMANDRIGSHDLTASDDAPVDGQFTLQGSEEADFTP